ncbi:SDR family oxidoreductase [Devosia sp. MC532]|nr:SDR family oxidoreductase [Devosia sp. MC532]
MTNSSMMNENGTGSSGAVFVLGASRGIGFATGVQSARQGHSTVFGCRNPKAVEGVVTELTLAGHCALAVQVDAEEPASIHEAYRQTVGFAGSIRTLIYNAGTIEPLALFSDISEYDWERIIHANLLGAARAVRHALPLLSPDPRIILLSSGAARHAVEGWSAYCVSKAGLSMLTKALALELGKKAFIAALSPGMVDTDMQAEIRASGRGAISAVARDTLTPAPLVAETLVALADQAPRALHGCDVTLEEARRMLNMDQI